jgi:hypothetical protein
LAWPLASKILGFLGDATTLAGGITLAWEAITREKEFVDKKKWGKTVRVLKQARLTRNGVILSDDEHVDLAFIRQSAKRAVVGTVILTIGFVFLFLSRICDALGS